jgi:hypothetical protein
MGQKYDSSDNDGRTYVKLALVRITSHTSKGVENTFVIENKYMEMSKFFLHYYKIFPS